MNTKHTPGPFRVEQSTPLSCYVVDETGMVVATVRHTNADTPNEPSGNARLIALAPEMLSCLDNLTQEIRRAFPGDLDLPAGVDAWLSLSRQAVRNANGQT